MTGADKERTIIEFEGASPGPLLIVIGAIHGNELAGLKALELVGKMLEVEPVTNPYFKFIGKMIGLAGNLPAITNQVRFIDEDLNRIWYPEKIAAIKSKPSSERSVEENELWAILSTVLYHIEQYKPTELFILDLHTTSSGGGIFAIPTDDPKSLSVAKNLHAPVILDMLQGIEGSTMHYFNNENFSELPTTAVAFEAGQHDDHTSVNRCIAAIVNCLRSIGCVTKDDVENIHDEVLQLYAASLPKTSRLLYRHRIIDGDNFKMKDGYKNFDAIQEGEVLACDRRGLIKAKKGGRILMPLYQNQGAEGFFIIKPEEN